MILKVQNLSLVLERMTVLYLRVLEVLEREKNFLILLDFENLLEIMREKDEILSALRALDRDRLKLQDHFAMAMDRKSDGLTLKEIGEALVAQGGPAIEGGERLLALRLSLGLRIEEVKNRLDRNRRFIEKSVENLQTVAANLSSAIAGRVNPGAAKTNTYNGKAKLFGKPAQSGSIVEKRF